MRHRADRAGRPAGGFAVAVLVCLLAGLPAGPAVPQDRPNGPFVPRRAVWDGEWPEADLAERVSDVARIRAHADRIGELDGVYGLLIVQRGDLLLERYWREGTRAKPHNLKSASKSVLSALVGLAIDQGHLELDQPIAEILPAAAGLEDPRKARITVRHLLTMTSGLQTTSYEGYSEWVESRDWVRSVLEQPMVAEPGTFFQYSTGNSHLLSAVLAAATGMSTREWAQSRLFDPMGIRIRDWEKDPTGLHIGGNNLTLTPRDMARYGQLFLDEGVWNGESLIPVEWAHESTRTSDLGLHPVYGTYRYLWWTDLVYEGAFTAVGFGGQYIFVSAPHDCVVVVTSTLESKGLDWTRELFDLLRLGILSAFEPSPRYFARFGLPPTDPAVLSLEHAIDTATGQLEELESRRLEAELETGPARTTSRVNLRRGPDAEEARLALVERGVELEVLERRNGWARVRTADEVGWIHGDYLAISNGSWRTAASRLRLSLAEFSDEVLESADEDRLPPVRSSPTLDAEAVRLPAQLDAAQAANQMLAAELEASRATLRGLEEELAATRDEIVAVESSRDTALQSRLAELGTELEAVKDDSAEQTRVIADTRAELEAAESDSRRALAANETLAADLEATRGALEARDDELTSARDSIAALEAASREALTENERLAAALEDRDERLATTRERIAELGTEAETSKTDRAELARALAAARVRAETAEERADQATTRTAAVTTDLGTAQSAIESVEDELAETRARVDAAEARAALSASANEDLERDLEASRAAGQDLEDELEVAGLTIAGLEAEAGDSDARNAELARALTEARGSLETLTADLEDSRVALASTEKEQRARASETEADLTADLEDRRAALADREEELTAARARISELEREATEARERGSDAAGSLETLQVRVAALEVEAEVATAEKGALAAELATTRDSLERMEREVARQRALQTADAGERTDVAEDLDRLRADLAETSEALRISEDRRAELVSELQVARERADRWSRSATSSSEDLEILGQHLDDFRDVLARREVELRQLRDANQTLTSELESERGDLDRQRLAQSVGQLLGSWTEAWSSQDVERYLAHYSKGYRPTETSQLDWQRERRLRLSQPSFIEVRVSDVEVSLVERGWARVRFHQSYRSNSYSSDTEKVLEIVREGGSWRIARELVIKP